MLLVKVCFQPHVNIIKCYLPYGVFLKCLKISIFETSRKYPRKNLCKKVTLKHFLLVIFSSF